MLNLSRRRLLGQAAVGFGSLALHSLVAAEDQQRPHFAPKAKRVIFLFMKGGPSQVDTFDYKPRLQKDDRKPLPFEKPRVQFAETGGLLASPWTFRAYGQSGALVSDLFPQVGQCADDLCIINSLHGTNSAHGGACLKLHTGSDTFVRPSMGSWITFNVGDDPGARAVRVQVLQEFFDRGGAVILDGNEIEGGIDERQVVEEEIPAET